MEMIYRKEFKIGEIQVNGVDRLKSSQILAIMQEAAGEHSMLLGTGREETKEKGLFWALIRYRIEIKRLPGAGEKVTVETWPMPTTRTAYPRVTVAYDADGKELFRSSSLWVLMSMDTRAMVLPGKSGVEVEGCVRGDEIPLPGSLLPRTLENSEKKVVRFSDLDNNGHVNNCRYMEWVDDLLQADFHAEHCPKEIAICYHSEAREGETVDISWSLEDGETLWVDAYRKEGEMSMGHSRVFSVRIRY